MFKFLSEKFQKSFCGIFVPVWQKIFEFNLVMGFDWISSGNYDKAQWKSISWEGVLLRSSISEKDGQVFPLDSGIVQFEHFSQQSRKF